MVAESYKSASQYVMNWMLDNFNADDTLSGINWLNHHRYLKVESEPPIGTIYRRRKDHDHEAFPDIYEYKLFLTIEILVPNNEPDEEAEAFWYEEKIEEVVISNTQIPKADLVIMGNVEGNINSILQSRYMPMFSDQSFVVFDNIEMDLQMDFRRRLN